jgi:hypothetical protein
MMLLNRDFAIQSASRTFCTFYKSEKWDPMQPSGRRDIPFGRPTVQSIIRPNDENFPSEPSSMSRSFKLFQLASVQMFQHHVRTTLSVRPAMGFLSKTQIWEVPCNHHNASIAFKIHTSRRQCLWSECASIRYENCLQQKCDRSNDRAAPCERSSNQERISAKFWKANRTVVCLDVL